MSNKVTSNTVSNETFYNVTGLLPGTTYELTVVAVSQGGNVIAEGQPSSPRVNTTGVTGRSIRGYNVPATNLYFLLHNCHNAGLVAPALTCNASMSANDVVMVTWSYIHTGGLPLTNSVPVLYI